MFRQLLIAIRQWKKSQTKWERAKKSRKTTVQRRQARFNKANPLPDYDAGLDLSQEGALEIRSPQYTDAEAHALNLMTQAEADAFCLGTSGPTVMLPHEYKFLTGFDVDDISSGTATPLNTAERNTVAMMQASEREMNATWHLTDSTEKSVVDFSDDDSEWDNQLYFQTEHFDFALHPSDLTDCRYIGA